MAAASNETRVTIMEKVLLLMAAAVMGSVAKIVVCNSDCFDGGRK